MSASDNLPKPKPPTLRFYIDDSGSRDPDRKPKDVGGVDWFGLGGVIVWEHDVDFIEREVTAFRNRWPFPSAPLHSYEIRMAKDGFAWIKGAGPETRAKFLEELTELMCSLPIVVHATVVDRPGYNKRYIETYGAARWSLCRTAFNIAVERAAKYAAFHKARLRVLVEQTDRPNEERLKSYFDAMRKQGLPFDAGRSAQYAPLGNEELSKTLLEFGVRTKKSIPMQLADLGLWPVCKGKYQPDNFSLRALTDRAKLIDAQCTPENGLYGIKYSCFS